MTFKLYLGKIVTISLLLQRGSNGFQAFTINNFIYRGTPLAALKTDWFGCVENCHNNAKCESYNFYIKEGRCEINSFGISRCEKHSGLVYFPGSVFQQIRKHKEENQQRSIAPATWDCADWLSQDNESRIYSIVPAPGISFPVFCDQTTEGGGWIVLQRRSDGSVNFNRSWEQYKEGFGNEDGEFWLGLDKIHTLTTHRKYKLRVDMQDFNLTTAHAQYELFRVGSESDGYRLNIGKYIAVGGAGDSLSYQNNMTFSTFDHDTDQLSNENCAEMFTGAWWYSKCHESNLNGPYKLGYHSSFADGVNWKSWRGYHYSLKTAEMKIRPVDFMYPP